MSAAAPGVVSCEGAPRDLGRDQGRAAQSAVRAAVARLPLATRLGVALPGARAALAARSRRDAICHFPHMSERLAGLARGAGASRAALSALLARELGAEGASAAAGEAIGVAPERTGGGALLARSLAAPPGAGARPFLVRRSAPEHDWRSVELTLPWLVPALAGVNERGLAVLALVFAPAEGSTAACAAPALLLAQDCLQRCDGVQKAIEWCERRPAGGSAALLLADASGELAELAVRGAERRVRRARDGVLAGAASAERAAALEKAAAVEAVLDSAALARALGAGEQAGPQRSFLLLDPAGRALEIDGARLAAVAEG